MLGALLAVVLYDLRHMFVPRAFFLVFTASAVLVACLSADSLQNLGLVFLVASAIGLAFFLLFVLSGGRAMGLGDAPIALGLALGAGARALAGLIFSFWIGALIGIALLVVVPRARRMGVEVPFVPFLAGGFLLAYFTTWDPFLIIAALFGT
jgi:prepilin signal peptidase PulO-like enzyme (type II secretory pathway)